MTDKTVLLEIDDKGVANLTLNRPDVCNALNDELINEMTSTIASFNSTVGLRVVVIRGANQCFCAGLDIAWMEKMAKAGPSVDGRRLAHLLLTVKTLNLPTIAVVDGPCIGGGVALASCCDISVASEEAYFSLPAVHLGAAPAIVAPFIIKAIGPHLAKRYLMTGERLSPARAREINLIHAVSMRAQLEQTIQGFIDQLLLGGPGALSTCKDMIAYCEDRPLDKYLIEEAARRTAKSRRSEEAKEGFNAFMEKRRPGWVQEN